MIPIQNIYYMLSYAFQELRWQGFRNVATEEFSNVADLCAAILLRGVDVLVKRGLGRAYLERTEELASPRGRIDLSESVKTLCVTRKRLVCTTDEFSPDTRPNRILKATMNLLLHADVAPKRKHALHGMMPYFVEVKDVPMSRLDWNVQFHRGNGIYRMLLAICDLVAKGLLQTQASGKTRLGTFFDEQHMCRLYEKFILEYYRKEWPDVQARASQIPWAVDDGFSELLPVMQSDIMLSRNGKVLIVDAKYYGRTTQAHHGHRSLHSANLYQIFSYVKNKEAEMTGKPHEVSGMLLYAKTDEETVPDQQYWMSGNRISVRTLDLNCGFSKIAAQLDEVVADYF